MKTYSLFVFIIWPALLSTFRELQLCGGSVTWSFYIFEIIFGVVECENICASWIRRHMLRKTRPKPTTKEWDEGNKSSRDDFPELFYSFGGALSGNVVVLTKHFCLFVRFVPFWILIADISHGWMYFWVVKSSLCLCGFSLLLDFGLVVGERKQLC